MPVVNQVLVVMVLCDLLMLLMFIISRGSANIDKKLTSHPNWNLLDRGDDCGHFVGDRIIGGIKATLGQYPWIALLGYVSDEENDWIDYRCGGVIINDRYIITAAHCSSEVQEATLEEVRLGEHNLSSEIDCVDSICAPVPQDIKVRDITCHEGFNEYDNHNDICLIRLASKIKFSDYVAPICMPSYDVLQKDTFVGFIMEIAGWGINELESNIMSEDLLTLKVPVVDKNICKKIYKIKGQIHIYPEQICAGGRIGEDSCNGDSGGPLMKAFSIDGPPRYFLIGILSFGIRECGLKPIPAVYSLVTKYWQWILDNIYK